MELLIFYVRHPVRDPIHHVPVVLFKPRLALFGHGVALLPSPAGARAADADAARVPRGPRYEKPLGEYRNARVGHSAQKRGSQGAAPGLLHNRPSSGERCRLSGNATR